MNAVAQLRDPDADAWAFTLTRIESAYRLNRPDARSFAMGERNRYLMTAIGLQKRAAAKEAEDDAGAFFNFQDKARHYQDRADSIAEIMERHKSRALYTQDRGMLAEQVAQPARRDPIVMLVEKGRLGHEHQLAAQQIAQCYEGVCKDLMPKVRDLRLFVPPPKNSGRKVFDGMSERLSDLYCEVYLPWTREMHARRRWAEPQNLSLVLDVVVDGLSIYAVRHRQRPMPSWNDTFATLKRGLELWGEIGR